jgi:hypothetical protein
MRRLLLLAALILLAAPAAARAAAPCLGDPTAAGVEAKPGAPRLRLGLNPAGEAGALGPKVPAVPEVPAKTLAALRSLQPRGLPLSLRLNRFFWSDGDAAVRHFTTLVNRYTRAGFLVELQLRYHPTPAQEGDVAGFARWVRAMVRRFGANPRVTAVQVTNEVNLPISPDSSDGAYEGATDALIRGVVAAKDEARRRGYGQLSVGFNWVYRWTPQGDAAFWAALGRGGPAFRRAVDWVGLDAYPGTFFPPAEPPGGEKDGIVAAMSTLRKCYMPAAGLGPRVPIHIEENGWPTGEGRSEARQVRAMRDMLGQVNRLRGTYGVTDYRWFDLRDHRTSSANLQHHYGVLRDDYAPKAGFAALRDLYARLTAPRPPRSRIALVARAKRCRATVRLTGPDLRHVRRVDLVARGKTVGRRGAPPWRTSFRYRRARRVTARIALDSGLVAVRRAKLPCC